MFERLIINYNNDSSYIFRSLPFRTNQIYKGTEKFKILPSKFSSLILLFVPKLKRAPTVQAISIILWPKVEYTQDNLSLRQGRTHKKHLAYWRSQSFAFKNFPHSYYSFLYVPKLKRALTVQAVS